MQIDSFEPLPRVASSARADRAMALAERDAADLRHDGHAVSWEGRMRGDVLYVALTVDGVTSAVVYA